MKLKILTAIFTFILIIELILVPTTRSIIANGNTIYKDIDYSYSFIFNINQGNEILKASGHKYAISINNALHVNTIKITIVIYLLFVIALYSKELDYIVKRKINKK